MKQFMFSIFALLMGMGSAFNADGATPTEAFEKIKSLAGLWRGLDEEGKPADLTFEVVADGSVVQARYLDMIDMYHLDGDRLMQTHYCSSRTQPRMTAVVPAGAVTELSFQFLDVTNTKPGDGHINSSKLIFKDENTLIEHWTWLQNGKEGRFDFEFTRVK